MCSSLPDLEDCSESESESPNPLLGTCCLECLSEQEAFSFGVLLREEPALTDEQRPEVSLVGWDEVDSVGFCL